MKGSAISDGKTMEIAVERCQLYRPKRFDQPQEVTQITAAIIRRGERGNTRYVLFSDSHYRFCRRTTVAKTPLDACGGNDGIIPRPMRQNQPAP
jgi:hypothetical protein